MAQSQDNFKKVKDWFSKLVSLPKSEQQSKINELKSDHILSAEQIKLLEQMLQADEGTDISSQMQNLSIDIATDRSDISTEQIGPYKIIKPLGEGGMGSVFLADRNDGEYEQKVALKLPHFNFSPAMKQRFENERQILAQLKHENISHLLDGGTTTDQQPYLVMEYIEGQTIDKYCVDNIPDLKTRVQLILQICSAVSFLHQQLILHRDLKPNNILVTSAGQVKLLDFGIAKLLDPNEEIIAQNTATQIMTRYYASPEQLQGKTTSTHSDLFSLAIIAYELITGYHPYKHSNQHEREQNLISGKILRITQRHTAEKPLFPELSQINSAKLQGDLENILIKALSVEPEKRYSSVNEFAKDMHNFLQNKPVIARKPNVFYLGKKLIQRHKVASASIFVMIISLIAASVFSLQKAKQAEEQKDQAILQKELAERESKKSKQISDILQDMFRKATLAEGETEVLAKDLLDQAIDRLKKDDSLEAEVKFNLMPVIFRSYAYLGKINDLQKSIQGTHELCIEQLPDYHENCQNILIYKAYTQHRLGRDDLAVQFYQQAEDIAKKEVPINTEMYIKILRNSFGPLYNTNQNDVALQKMELASDAYESLPDHDLKKVRANLGNLIIAYIQNKQYAKAEKALDRVLSIIKQLKLETSDEMADYYNLRASLYSNTHEALKSVEDRKRSIELYNSIYKQPTQVLGLYLFNYSRALFVAGQIEESLEMFDKTYEHYQNYGNGQTKNFIEIQIQRGLVLLANNDIDQAQKVMDQIIELGIENYSTNPYEQCELKIFKAHLSIETNLLAEAQTHLTDMQDCSKDSSYRMQMYWPLLNSILSYKQRDLVASKKFFSDLQILADKHPNDQFGLKNTVIKRFNKIIETE